MKVLSIDPNDGKYFLDKSDYVTQNDKMYHGNYGSIPIYPRYTFVAMRYDVFLNPNPLIIFHTMLPIKHFLSIYIVQIELRITVNPREEDTLENAIHSFKNTCEKMKKTINLRRIKKQIQMDVNK